MSEVLEGKESGHPDNARMIEREIEHESSLEISEAKTRGRTYDMAKDTNYRQHFWLAMVLIGCNAIVSAVTYYYMGKNELDGQGAIIIGTIQSSWSAAMMAAILWYFGSSMSSQNKSKVLEKELGEDGQ